MVNGLAPVYHGSPIAVRRDTPAPPASRSPAPRPAEWAGRSRPKIWSDNGFRSLGRLRVVASSRCVDSPQHESVDPGRILTIFFRLDKPDSPCPAPMTYILDGRDAIRGSPGRWPGYPRSGPVSSPSSDDRVASAEAMASVPW